MAATKTINTGIQQTTSSVATFETLPKCTSLCVIHTYNINFSEKQFNFYYNNIVYTDQYTATTSQ